MVNCDGGAAAAFVGKIGGKTYLISNLHVLGKMKNARITTLDGREIRFPKTCFFGEKYANLSMGYRDLKIYCNKRGKDF